MFQYAPNPAGPVYLVIGDGGNVEGCAPPPGASRPRLKRDAPHRPYRSFVDDIFPGSTQSFCTVAWGAKNFAANASAAGGCVFAPEQGGGSDV